MNPIDELKGAILKELLNTAKGALPDSEEALFWGEIAEEFANEKLRFLTATTPEEKEKVASNLVILQATMTLRLGRKKLKVRNSAEKIASMVFKTIVRQFFPGAELIGDLAKLIFK